MSSERPSRLKRIVLLLAGAFVLVYCLAVFIYVTHQPNKGFYVFAKNTVADVQRGSSAWRGGIQPGDTILRIGDNDVINPFTVINLSKQLDVGETVPVSYVSNTTDQRIEVPVEITVMPFPGLLLFWMVCSLVLVSTGYVFHYRRSEDKPTTLFYLLCLLTAATFMGAFRWHVIAGNIVLITAFVVVGALIAPVGLHFFLIYPRTNPLVKRLKGLTALIYVPSLVYLFGMLLVLGKAGNIIGEEKLISMSAADMVAALKTLVFVQLGVTALYVFVAAVSLRHCQRTTLQTDVKNQIKWIWWGVAAAAIPVILMLALMTEGAGSLYGEIQFMAMLAVMAVLVATGLSLLKYRLMYVDAILNRSLAYVMVSALMMLIFLAAVGIVSWLLSKVTGQKSLMVFLISTLAITFFFKPVSDWVQKIIDRKFYRERYEFQQAVYSTSQDIVRILDLDRMLRQIMSTILESLHVKRGAILLWHRGEERMKVAVSRGYLEPGSQLTLDVDDPLLLEVFETREPATTRQFHEQNWSTGGKAELIARMVKMHAEAVIPVIREDDVLGLFVLGRKRSRQIYSSEDVRLLMTLANHAAVGIHNARNFRTMEKLNRDLTEQIGKTEEQRREILGLQQQLLSENVYLKEEIEQKYNFQDIIGTSKGIQDVLETVKKVAPSSSAVLLRGESGVGKELVARAIHYNSQRRDKPFVRVNCAVLSEGLLESELFGHTKGSFTGAVADRQGRFEVADGGTIFLDEIGDVSLQTQVKLMRVLQEKEFERVGANRTRKVDVRVIAATNRNLEDLMRTGKFREDLFYRLNVIAIEVPALRQRKEDIYPLAIHFLTRYARDAGKTIQSIDSEVADRLKRYPWPGNVRELENLIERAVVLADGPVLKVEDFPQEIEDYEEIPTPTADGTLSRRLEAIEREGLKKALREANGNKSRAARQLGLARSTFISKLKKWSLT